MTEFDDRVDVQTDLSLPETFSLLGRSLALLAKVKSLFVAKLIFASVSLLPALAVPWFLKIVVDQVILQQPFNTDSVPFPPFMMPFINAIRDLSPMDIMLAVTGLYVVLLMFFGMRSDEQHVIMPEGFDSATQSEQLLSSGTSKTSGVWGFLELLLTVRLTQRLANGLRTRLMGRLSHLDMTTLDDQRIGDSVYRVMYDAPMMPAICFKLTIEPVMALLAAFLSVYLLGYSYGRIAPELIYIAAAMVPVIILLTGPLSGLVRRAQQRSRAAGATTTNQMEESIDNIGAVQSLGGMKGEARRFAGKSAESFRHYRFTVLLDNLLLLVSFTTITLAIALAFFLITNKVIEGNLTPGDYAVMIGMFATLGVTAQAIGMFWINLQKNISAVRRVFFFIDYTTETDRGSKPLESIERTVFLENVSYHYPDGRQALADINLEFALGELAAIVGPTGAGKTSLAYLLPGYLKPSTGQIRFDDQDLAEVDVKDIRELVTYVFQEHMLLSDTIRENLAIANPDASEKQMMETCRIAGAMEFISDLPEGFDTVIGKSGDTLSVGQKQRLSIARGIIRDTPILILDEPTAALDPQTENALVAALREIARNKLVIVIAHRLSTIRQADKIVFLEEGRVRDIGSHDELMRDRNSRYRKFVELQSV